MGGAFSQDFIESVRNAGDIVRVVSDYVPLKQAGARLKGLCPFHQEKTPSFSVDPNAQLFYCFGCQTGGDLFKFVMLYDKVGFGEAVEGLARRFGVPLPKRESSPQLERAFSCISMPSFWSRCHQPEPNCILPGEDPSWKFPIIVERTKLSQGLTL